MGKEAEKAAETPKQKKPGRWKRRLVAFAIVLAVLWGAAALVPHLLSFVTFPEVFVDLSKDMKDMPPGLFPDQTLRAKYSISRRSGGGYELTAKGRVLGWPFTVSADVDLAFRFFGVDVRGTAQARLDGSQLGVAVAFEASAPGGWKADVTMPETPLGDNDPFIKSVLARHPEEAVRRIVFDGILSLTAQACQEGLVRGFPRWEAKARVKNLDASLDADGKPVRIENFRVGVGASGLADHVDIAPMFVHIDTIEAAGVTMTNAFASIRATEAAFLVTEAGAGVCGGDLHLYALFLDPKKLNAGVTIYMDGIDAGQALSHVNGFKGEATGKLNGKLKLRLKEGNELHFMEGGYLHSVPGEQGNIKIYDAEPITDNLMMSCISKETCDNVADALSDLDYSVLKIALTPEGDGMMALTMKLEGTATRGNVSVPVSFTVTFHGQIEELINTGLRVAQKGKGKKKDESSK